MELDMQREKPLDDQKNDNHKDESKVSCLDFDREENRLCEDKKVSELSTEELIKVVIRRGEDEKNPVISGGCGRVLKQINRERIGRNKKGPRSRRTNYDEQSYRKKINGRGMNNGRNNNRRKSEWRVKNK